MKVLLVAVVVVVALTLSGGVVAQRSWVPPYGPPLVVSGHDREPFHERREGQELAASTDDECNENHHLQPDGDNDCDDKPVKSIPEPATLGLLGLGVVGLVLSRLRKRG